MRNIINEMMKEAPTVADAIVPINASFLRNFPNSPLIKNPKNGSSGTNQIISYIIPDKFSIKNFKKKQITENLKNKEKLFYCSCLISLKNFLISTI